MSSHRVLPFNSRMTRPSEQSESSKRIHISVAEPERLFELLTEQARLVCRQCMSALDWLRNVNSLRPSPSFWVGDRAVLPKCPIQPRLPLLSLAGFLGAWAQQGSGCV